MGRVVPLEEISRAEISSTTKEIFKCYTAYQAKIPTGYPSFGIFDSRESAYRYFAGLGATEIHDMGSKIVALGPEGKEVASGSVEKLYSLSDA